MAVFGKKLLMWTTTVACVLLWVCLLIFKPGSAGGVWKMSCDMSVCVDQGKEALRILILKIKLCLLKEL